MQTSTYRTESGHAPGEVTPAGVGVLHGAATRHKPRRHSDGSMHFGARHHFEKAEEAKFEALARQRGWHRVGEQQQKSKSNSAESDLLLLFFNNTNFANVGDATGLRGSTTAGNFGVALHTGDPGETGTQTTSEATFTSYARVAVARSSGGWTISGTAPTQAANAAAVTFPACTGGSNTCTFFSVGTKTDTSAGEIMYSGALTASLSVSNGITAAFAISALTCTED